MNRTESAPTCDTARHYTLNAAHEDGWRAGFEAGKAIGAEEVLLALQPYLPADLPGPAITHGGTWAAMKALRAADPADSECGCPACGIRRDAAAGNVARYGQRDYPGRLAAVWAAA
jgi:hypothetical protein